MSINSTPTLSVNALTVHRGSRQRQAAVLNGVSFTLNAGQVMAILGPNGAGKTTLLHAISGELPYQQGHVFVNGRSLTHLNAQALAHVRVVLPQQHTMTFDMPVGAIVQMGAYPFMTIAPSLVHQWVQDALRCVQLQSCQHKGFLTLSGGQQQRVQFARLLVQAYAIIKEQGCVSIFLDEPTASLDPKYQVLLMRTVRELANQKQAAVAVVMHDLNMAAQWCDRVLLLSAGQQLAYDEPRRVLTSERLTSVYGLPMHVWPHPTRSNQVWVTHCVE